MSLILLQKKKKWKYNIKIVSTVSVFSIVTPIYWEIENGCDCSMNIDWCAHQNRIMCNLITARQMSVVIFNFHNRNTNQNHGTFIALFYLYISIVIIVSHLAIPNKMNTIDQSYNSKHKEKLQAQRRISQEFCAVKRSYYCKRVCWCVDVIMNWPMVILNRVSLIYSIWT